MDNLSNRQLAANLARQLYERNITFSQLLDDYPEDTYDTDIEELFDLIEHEPKVGGFLGVSQSYHDDYMTRIFKLIAKLEESD